jgi:aryl-alcohol dehydrogenase-like predicted oxidoreductase
MRLESEARATITAAVDAGVTVFDTARAYGAAPGENERLLADALRAHPRGPSGLPPRIVTKGGMTRPGGGWVPDGRAKVIAADCEASLTALDGLPIDLYLLHAPDPRVPWATSIRALKRLLDSGLVATIGLSNVNRAQLDEACALAPIAAVEVALSWADDGVVRGGVLERCEELGIAVIAHSPLGGPRRAARLQREPALAAVAADRGATVAEVALAWLLELSPAIVPIPGARRPQTARSLGRAAALTLTERDRAALGERYLIRSRPPVPAQRSDAEVVIVMGIPGAGKSRVAAGYGERGYVRLNRDELGGTLADLAAALDDALGAGEITRAVLDNTYLSRASRSYVIDAAARHGVAVRCVWLDTPLDQAQVNLVLRLLQRFGSLPSADELRAAARHEPGLMLPTSQMRAARELEAPSAEEGFAAVERIEFSREPAAGAGVAGALIAASALGDGDAGDQLPSGDGPVLVFDWRPDGSPSDLADLAARVHALTGQPVHTAVCPHGGGPPACWCRPPLPGLPLAFAHEHGLALERCTLIGTSNAHRTLARVVGCRFVK